VAAAPLAVIVPMLVACGLAAASPFTRRRQGVVAVAGALAALALSVAVLGDDASRVIVWFGGWEPRAGVALGVAFAIDTLGAALAVFVAALGVVALVVSSRLMRVEQLAFDALMLVFVAAMIGFCLTGDLFNMFVFFELMSVSAYVLVAYEVRHRAALEGSLTFAVTTTVGSLLLLFGTALIYGRTGALNLAQIGRALSAGPDDALVVVAFSFLVCGMFVKAAIVPFHMWTADAYAVAPTPVCILLAGAFSELGLYGIARLYWTAFHDVFAAHTAELQAVFIAAGLVTALVGAVMCAVQHHLKRMLAFATIAQVGLFMVGLGLLNAEGVAGTAIWVVGDGLVKAGLFTCVAIVHHRYGDLEVADLHGRARGLWPIGALFALGALMIASLPVGGPFLGKAVVEDGVLAAGGHDWVPALMLLSSALVGAALLRAGARVFLGLGRPATRDPAGEEEDEEPEREAGGSSPLLWITAAVLMLGGLAWGLVPGLVDAAGRAAASFADQHGYAAAVLGGRPSSPPVPELPGPSTTAYLYALGSLALAVGLAAADLAAARPLPRALSGAVGALRRIHNGRAGDYVAWTVAGSAVCGGLFAALLR
jgi:multicomponent Na+:H+ antiporter subunit D